MDPSRVMSIEDLKRRTAERLAKQQVGQNTQPKATSSKPVSVAQNTGQGSPCDHTDKNIGMHQTYVTRLSSTQPYRSATEPPITHPQNHRYHPHQNIPLRQTSHQSISPRVSTHNYSAPYQPHQPQLRPISGVPPSDLTPRLSYHSAQATPSPRSYHTQRIPSGENSSMSSQPFINKHASRSGSGRNYSGGSDVSMSPVPHHGSRAGSGRNFSSGSDIVSSSNQPKSSFEVHGLGSRNGMNDPDTHLTNRSHSGSSAGSGVQPTAAPVSAPAMTVQELKELTKQRQMKENMNKNTQANKPSKSPMGPRNVSDSLPTLSHPSHRAPTPSPTSSSISNASSTHEGLSSGLTLIIPSSEDKPFKGRSSIAPIGTKPSPTSQSPSRLTPLQSLGEDHWDERGGGGGYNVSSEDSHSVRMSLGSQSSHRMSDRMSINSQSTHHTGERMSINSQSTHHTGERMSINSQSTHHTGERSSINSQSTHHTGERMSINSQSTHHTGERMSINSQSTHHTGERSSINSQGTNHTGERSSINSQGTNHTAERMSISSQGTNYTSSTRSSVSSLLYQNPSQQLDPSDFDIDENEETSSSSIYPFKSELAAEELNSSFSSASSKQVRFASPTAPSESPTSKSRWFKRPSRPSILNIPVSSLSWSSSSPKERNQSVKEIEPVEPPMPISESSSKQSTGGSIDSISNSVAEFVLMSPHTSSLPNSFEASSKPHTDMSEYKDDDGDVVVVDEDPNRHSQSSQRSYLRIPSLSSSSKSSSVNSTSIQSPQQSPVDSSSRLRFWTSSSSFRMLQKNASNSTSSSSSNGSSAPANSIKSASVKQGSNSSLDSHLSVSSVNSMKRSVGGDGKNISSFNSGDAHDRLSRTSSSGNSHSRSSSGDGDSVTTITTGDDDAAPPPVARGGIKNRNSLGVALKEISTLFREGRISKEERKKRIQKARGKVAPSVSTSMPRRNVGYIPGAAAALNAESPLSAASSLPSIDNSPSVSSAERSMDDKRQKAHSSPSAVFPTISNS